MEIEGKVVRTESEDDQPRADVSKLPRDRETKDVKRAATLEDKDAPLITGKRQKIEAK